MVRLSRRVPAVLAPNRLAATRARLGPAPFDLTESNPTRCDLPYPPDLLAPLAHRRSLRYEPDPQGPMPARRAVAATYRRWGVEVAPEQVLLTASTSEAYGFLLRLLADPGDTVLVPSPSYPLFDQLARLDGVRLATYRLDGDDHWRLEPDWRRGAPPGWRALILVHPNNPTGSFVHPDDAALLRAACEAEDAALVADEVFLPYPLGSAPDGVFTFAAPGPCLTFSLGGLSKSIGLPQLKLGWVVVSGPDAAVAAALERLAYIADAYLSVATPVALAAPELLQRGLAVQGAIAGRCRSNLARLVAATGGDSPVTLLSPQGGWSAVVRVPNLLDEEELALRLLTVHGVAVHPGFLFDFERPGHLVLSLLPREEVFAEGVGRLLEAVDELVRNVP